MTIVSILDRKMPKTLQPYTRCGTKQQQYTDSTSKSWKPKQLDNKYREEIPYRGLDVDNTCAPVTNHKRYELCPQQNVINQRQNTRKAGNRTNNTNNNKGENNNLAYNEQSTVQTKSCS